MTNDPAASGTATPGGPAASDAEAEAATAAATGAEGERDGERGTVPEASV